MLQTNPVDALPEKGKAVIQQVIRISQCPLAPMLLMISESSRKNNLQARQRSSAPCCDHKERLRNKINYSNLQVVNAPSRWMRRWTIVALCFFAFMLCNMDRVNMSIAVLPMSKQFGWDSGTIGVVQSSFFWYSYLLLIHRPSESSHCGLSKLFVSLCLILPELQQRSMKGMYGMLLSLPKGAKSRP